MTDLYLRRLTVQDTNSMRLRRKPEVPMFDSLRELKGFEWFSEARRRK